MEILSNDITTAHNLLPAAFKSFNDTNVKEIHESILHKPLSTPKEESKTEDEEEGGTSFVILHLAENTKGLISFLQGNKDLLLKSGHLSLEEQSMIVQILYQHAFGRKEVSNSDLFKILGLIQDFIQSNYNKLMFEVDWKLWFNTMLSLFLDSDSYYEMFALSSKKHSFYGLIEKVMLKLNKFFPQGSAIEIFEAWRPHLFAKDPKFNAYLFCFSILMPTNRFNTNEEEVEEWLPFIFDLWKTNAYSHFNRNVFIRLFAQVSQYFNRLDFSQYSEWIAYQFNLMATKSSNPQESRSFYKSHSERHFASYFVNTFKSTEHIEADSKMNNESAEDDRFKSLILMYSDYLHPSNKFKNKPSLVFFLKFLSSSLCCRVRFERQKLLDDPDFRYKYLFLQQQDIVKFICYVKPMIETALQGEKWLDKLGDAIKNFITLDCDEILSLFLLSNFTELEGLSKSKFIKLLTEIVPGVLVNDQHDVGSKFEFIQKVLDYLVNQVESFEGDLLKDTIKVFNAIWSVLPVLPKEWGQGVVEQTSKSKDYTKYMRTMNKKRKQEYQFYKLYENIHEYATKYFKVLVNIMNLGVPIADELTSGFWYLLNVISNKLLVKDLVDSWNQDHAGPILGKVLANVSERDHELAIEITKHLLSKLISDEGGIKSLSYNNYKITHYYLTILSSIIYRSKETVYECFADIFELIKLLVNEAEEDMHRGDVASLVKSVLGALTTFSVKTKHITEKEVWSSVEYQSKIWSNIGKLDPESIEFTLSEITNSDVDMFIDIMKNYFISWLKSAAEIISDKNSMKSVTQILCEIEASVCSLLPSKNSSEKHDFTSHYYRHIEIPDATLDSLKAIENELFEIAELLNLKLTSDEQFMRDITIVKHLGLFYKHVISSNQLKLKDAWFKENKQIYSMLEYKEVKRLESSFITEVSSIINTISKLGEADYDSNDKLSKSCVDRVYEYEGYFAAIPTQQNQVKIMSDPEFIIYFKGFTENHMSKLVTLYEYIMSLIVEMSKVQEIAVVTRDELVGKLILYDKMANSDVFKRTDHVIRIMTLVYTSASIKDEKVIKYIWVRLLYISFICYKFLSNKLIFDLEYMHQGDIIS